MKNFLKDFMDKGMALGFFLLQEIKAIEKTCCSNSTTQVIDFDVVEEKLRKGKGLQSLKSCDCLKILPTKSRIDFIEMKGIKLLINHSKNRSDASKLSGEIRQKIEDFNFLGKIRDSISVQVKRIKIHSRRESMFIEIEMDMHEKSRRDFM